MRACCKAQDVIVLRPIQNREVLCPRRGSNPARMTLTRNNTLGAPRFSPHRRWEANAAGRFLVFEHEHEDDSGLQNRVHFKSNQTYGAPLAS